MAITASELIGRVSIQGAEKAQAQLLGLGASSDNAAAKFAGLAVGAGALLAGALVAIGAVSAKMAGNFEQATNTLITSAGLSKNSIDAVRQGILRMSVDTATSTDQLVKGMFNVQSALHLGAGGLQVLKAAAEGAKAENSDLAATTDVLTTAMVNYHLSAAQAVPTMNSLIVTIAAGKMHMNDLTGALKNVLPVAAAFHIHLADVEGALASMANAGDRGTSAGTHLAMMFKMLENPIGAAKKEMAAMGLDSVKLAQTLNTSLPDALKMIQTSVASHFTPGSVAYNRAIQTILGGSKSGVAGLEIFNQGLKVLGQNTADAAGALRKGGKDVENWSTIQGGFNFKLDAAKNAVEAVAIKLGTALLPFLKQILEKVTPLITNFGNWETSSHGVERALGLLGTVLSTIGSVIGNVASGIGQIIGFFQSGSPAAQAVAVALGMIAGALAAVAIGSFVAAIPALVAGFIAWAVAAGAAAVATIAATWPLLLIGAAVALVIAGIILAVQHWGAISAWIGGVMSALGSKVHEILGNIGGAFSAMGTKVHDVLSGIGAFVGGVFSGIGTKIHDALTGAATFVLQKVTDIQNFFKELPGKIQAALANLGTILLAPFKWLYDHNYYVHDFVEGAKLAFTLLKQIVGQVFDWIGTKIRDALTGIKNTVGSGFDWIGTKIRDALTATKNTVGSIFSAIGTTIQNVLTTIKNVVGNIFSAIGTTIRNLLTAAKNDVGNIFSIMGSLVSQKLNDLKTSVGNSFSALGSLMHQKLTDAWNALVNFASGWPAQAFQWGISLITGLIGGLGAKLGALRDMAGQVAGAIKGALGFHQSEFGVPAEGPAHDADKWMPAFIAGMVNQLTSGQSRMKAALNSLISPLAASAQATLHLQATGSLGNLGGSLSTPNLSANYALYGGMSGGNTIHVHVHTEQPVYQIDGYRLAGALMPHIHKKILYGTGFIGP